MKVNKVLIGSHPTPLIKPIPDAIVRRKTISMNALGELKIFCDRSPDAIEWIEAVVPTLMIGRKEDILKKFWSMNTYSWWEFNTGTKRLYLCSLEN